jgi:hypothetical protein
LSPVLWALYARKKHQSEFKQTIYSGQNLPHAQKLALTRKRDHPCGALYWCNFAPF